MIYTEKMAGKPVRLLMLIPIFAFDCLDDPSDEGTVFTAK